MPSIVAHMVIAKRVSDNLNYNSSDFIRGNLLPDIIDLNDSHYKIEKGYYLIPDINYYVKTHSLDSYLNKGYLSHLLLDRHFLDEYLSEKYKRNIFIDGLIYRDYDYLNNDLLSRFNIDLEELIPILLNYKDSNINEEKLRYNIDCLKRKSNGDLKYLDLKDFSNFLLNVSDKIGEELKYYENESSKLYVHIRERKK
jgi:hypothetical protein